MDEPDRPWLRRKLPVNGLLMTATLGPGAVFGFFVAGFNAGQWDVAVLASGFILLALTFNYLSDRGYQLGSDFERIYARDWGYRGFFKRHPEHSMSYGEILSMEGRVHGSVPTSYVPFDFLELTSSDADNEPILIDPGSFPDVEIKAFLSDLHIKRPDIFPDYVLEYMRSARRF